MPRHISEATKLECVRLRIEERLTAPQIAKTLGISNASAYLFTEDHPLSAEDMAARRRNTARSWTKEELQILARLWPTADRTSLERHLPRRKWASIIKKASDIGIRRPPFIRQKKRRATDQIFIHLRAIREARGISREELGQKIGIHRVLLARYELGENRPSWFNFRSWLEALECDIRIAPRDS